MTDLVTERARATLERLYDDDARQRAAGLPPARRTRNLDRESGRLLALTVVATAARAIAEVGSSNGVSTIWLASGARLTGGRVVGAELLPNRAAEANRNLAAAGLSGSAEVVAGDAREILPPRLAAIDLLFIDAEKEDYPGHLLALVDRVRPGGLIVADNVLSHDLSAYQSLLRARADLATVTLPLERGLEFTVKVPSEPASRALHD